MHTLPTSALLCLALALSVPAFGEIRIAPADKPAQQATAPEEAPKAAQYTVQSGDTLYKIAKKFSISSKDIIRANNIKDASKLQIGQTLVIPAAAATRAAATRAAAGEKITADVKSETAPKPRPATAQPAGKTAEKKTAAAKIRPTTQTGAVKPAPKKTTAVVSNSFKAGPAAGKTAAPKPAGPLEYTVQSGDTLNGIAKKFSVPPRKIAKASKLKDASKLSVGQKLIIPGAATAASAKEKKLTKARLTPAKTPAAVMAVTPVAKPAPAPKAAKGEKVTAAVAPPKPAPAKKPAKRARRRAGIKTGIITNNTDVPDAIRREFQKYGEDWIDVSIKLAVGTKDNKKIRKNGDAWEASYRIILKDTVGTEVKRVHYDHTPYVGHLTYQVRSFHSTGASKKAALAGPFKEEPQSIREIFSYDGKKKAWR